MPRLFIALNVEFVADVKPVLFTTGFVGLIKPLKIEFIPFWTESENHCMNPGILENGVCPKAGLAAKPSKPIIIKTRLFLDLDTIQLKRTRIKRRREK